MEEKSVEKGLEKSVERRLEAWYSRLQVEQDKAEAECEAVEIKLVKARAEFRKAVTRHVTAYDRPGDGEAEVECDRMQEAVWKTAGETCKGMWGKRQAAEVELNEVRDCYELARAKLHKAEAELNRAIALFEDVYDL